MSTNRSQLDYVVEDEDTNVTTLEVHITQRVLSDRGRDTEQALVIEALGKIAAAGATKA